jgi:hypothetical protein
MVVLVGVSENGIYRPQKWQFQLGTINIVIKLSNGWNAVPYFQTKQYTQEVQ